jgi:two-component system, NarL family, nitrate/nitrite response regulator NarL
MTEGNLEAIAGALDQASGATWTSTYQVTTILIGECPLLCVGLKHILSETRFAVSEAECGAGRPILTFPDAISVLFIVSAMDRPSTMVERIRRLKTQCPDARVCVLADHLEIDAMMSAYDAGADGLCLTSAGRDVLLGSLELIMLGESVFPSTMALSMLDQTSCRPERGLEPVTSTHKTEVRQVEAHRLSPREGDILGCLMEGSPNKVIAWQYGLTEATVKVHVKAILRKTGAKNRTQAAIWAANRSFGAPSVKPRYDGR